MVEYRFNVNLDPRDLLKDEELRNSFLKGFLSAREIPPFVGQVAGATGYLRSLTLINSMVYDSSLLYRYGKKQNNDELKTISEKIYDRTLDVIDEGINSLKEELNRASGIEQVACFSSLLNSFVSRKYNFANRNEVFERFEVENERLEAEMKHKMELDKMFLEYEGFILEKQREGLRKGVVPHEIKLM